MGTEGILEVNKQHNFKINCAKYAKMAKIGRQGQWKSLWLLSNQSNFVIM